MFRWLTSLILITVLSLFVVPVRAANFNIEEDGGLNTTATAAGIKNTSTSVETSVATILKEVLSLVGVIFFALMIYAGIMWMTAAGNEQQVDKARDVLTAALIGLIIVIAAYTITQFIGNSLMNTTT